MLMYHPVRRACARGGANRRVHIPPQSLSLLVSRGEAEKMGKGFYISKVVGVVGGILAVGAVATIIALSVVYVQEKAKNNEPPPTDGTQPTQPTAATPATQPTDPTDPTGGTTPDTTHHPWNNYRLPKDLVPHTYHVTLWPRLTPDKDTGLYIFTGKAS